MIDFLMGVPGKLDAILAWFTSYWTAVRAVKLDNLDAAMSTRAAASTALTNATWTDVRAAKLDTVLSGSIIQSIQHSSVTQGGTNNGASYTGTVTIASVNTAKSIIITRGRVLSGPGTTPTDPGELEVYLAFGGSTTVNAARNSMSTTAITTYFTVLEFK
jgi:hypothetical protein